MDWFRQDGFSARKCDTFESGSSIINSDGSSEWRVVWDENLRTGESSFIFTEFLTWFIHTFKRNWHRSERLDI
jgi:hypothetical protein